MTRRAGSNAKHDTAAPSTPRSGPAPRTLT